MADQLPQFTHPCLPFQPHPVYGDQHISAQCESFAHFQAASSEQKSRENDNLHGGPSGTSAATAAAASLPQNPLLQAVLAGNVALLNSLLLQEQQQQIPPLLLPGQMTLLHHAAARGVLPSTSTLLKSWEVDVDARDAEDETPLFKACFYGHELVVSLLLSKGASVHAADKNQWTPLHNCASKDYFNIAEILIAQGANVNARNNHGTTPLMNAASKGFVELARLLLQRGADPSIKNNFGNTAYDLAAQSENTILCQLIVKHLSSSSLLSPSSSCLVCVFENQRAPLFSTVYSDSNLISKQDPPPWSLISFNPNNNPNSTPVASLSSIPLPTAAFWLTDWKVDKRFQIGMSTSGSSSLIGGEGGTVDEDGWMYARTFPTSSSSSSYSSKLEEWSATPPQMGYFGGVRRRMWIRVWNKHLNEPETYIEIAMRRLHVTVPVGADLFGGIAEEAEETQLDILKDVIQGLLDGIKDDTDQRRRERAGQIVSECLERGEDLQRTLSKGKQPEISSSQLEERRVDALEQQLTSTSLSPSLPVNIPSQPVRRSSVQSHSFTSNSDLVAATSPPMAMTPPPAWQRDEEANECGLCDRKFTLFIRRHHCRWCGKVYCANCTTARIPIPTSSSSDNSTLQSEQRVCDTCHGLLTGISSPLHRLRVQSSVAEHKTPLLSPSAASSPRHESSPLESSIMNECPVCGDALSMNQAEAEFHLNQCINNQGAASVSAISGKRYVVTIVEPGLFSSASNSMRDVKGKMNAVASSAALAAAAIDTPHHSSDDSSDTEVIGSTSTQPAATAFSIEFDCSNNSRSSTTRVKFSNSISATIETNEIPPYQPREGDMNSSPRSDSSSPLPSPPPQSSFSDGGIIHECVICFEEFQLGERIARLDCLCVYHERCVQAWFEAQGKLLGDGKFGCPVHNI